MADQTPESLMADAVLSQKEDPSALSVMMNNRAIFWGGLLLLIFVVVAIFGPLFVGDPVALNPTKRLKPPSAEIFFGSDFLGRDIFSRVIYGARTYPATSPRKSPTITDITATAIPTASEIRAP